MAGTKRCAHEACMCMVGENSQFGAYCSSHCQDAKDLTQLKCECGHAGCMSDGARRASNVGGK
jgi:hypothetical protein